MSLETGFECDFCRKKLVNVSLNPDFIGYTKDDSGVWTKNLYSNLKGPHICKSCIRALEEIRP